MNLVWCFLSDITGVNLDSYCLQIHQHDRLCFCVKDAIIKDKYKSWPYPVWDNTTKRATYFTVMLRKFQLCIHIVQQSFPSLSQAVIYFPALLYNIHFTLFNVLSHRFIRALKLSNYSKDPPISVLYNLVKTFSSP